MKVIKSSVSVVEQGPGIVGMKKHIELIGKVSHKSEANITDTSYEKFIATMKTLGHWASLDMGTAYLKFPFWCIRLFWKLLKHHPWSKFSLHHGSIYATTTYRIIVQEDIEKEMEKYWSEPGEYHYRRATARFISSRFVSHQFVRHASLRPLQESQRYVDLSKEKHGAEVTYILPQWVYDVRDKLGHTKDPETRKTRKYLLELDGQELWDELKGISKLVSKRNDVWKKCEREYLWEVTNEEMHLNPEDARGILPSDVKTEYYLCGYLSDWYKKPKTKEKTGFFYLRCDKAAQRDARVLAQELEKQFSERGYSEELS